jgi:proteasome lid subunit RPN8/RPN11
MEATRPQSPSTPELRLPRAAYDHMRAHAEEAYPAECCGVLLGQHTAQGWRIDETLRATNASSDAPHNRYSIAPQELVKIETAARRRGLQIVGFYHSHPDQPAHWSRTDLAEAHWIGCCYVITEVVQGRAAATRSFLLDGTTEEDKRFTPQPIHVHKETAEGGSGEAARQ